MSMQEEARNQGESNNTQEEAKQAPRYYIDLDLAKESGRSLSNMVAARKCYTCRQSDTQDTVMSSRPETHIRRIVRHCAEAEDYLLPDTPLKESIFRLILAGSNKPVTPEEISRDLTVKWALSANRRNVSQRVIQRLLDNSASYCVVREPEPEPDPPPAPAVEPQAGLDPTPVSEGEAENGQAEATQEDSPSTGSAESPPDEA